MNNQDNTSLPPLQDDNTNQSDDSGHPAADGTSNPSVASAANPLSDGLPLSATAPVDIPEEAGDVDLIEKQWVVKAKQIVEQTNEDPHRQQQEIAKMKTEYIKKRYKRDIQL